jgi:hypothetical protein
VRANKKGVVVDYELSGGSGPVVADLSGNGRSATIHGDVTRSADGLVFGGTSGYVRLPDNLTTGLEEFTVSARVRVDPAQLTPYVLWSLGNGTKNTGDGERPLSRGVWHTLTYTSSNGKACLFDDGVELSCANDVNATPRDLGGGMTTSNFIGRSADPADNCFRGKMRRLTVWNRALTAQEILAVHRGQR